MSQGSIAGLRTNGGGSTVTDDEVLAEYVEWLRAWASAKTVRDRSRAVRAFLRDAGGLTGVSARSINAFLGKPKANGEPRGKWTRATYYGHLKSFCQFLMAAGYLEADPMDATPSPRRPKGRPHPLSELDVDRVLQVASGDVRDWIVVALASGLRVSEIAKLRGEDVSSEGIYVEGKGDTRETIPVHPDVLAVAARKPRHGYWWPGKEDGHVPSARISRKVGDLFSSLGINGSIHRCRHTFCTRMLRSGESVRTVQKIMRHASLETTANYAAVDEDAMTRAVRALPSANRGPLPPAA